MVGVVSYTWCYVSAVTGSYRARNGLYRFTLVWYCVDYVLLLCLGRVDLFTRWYGVLSTLHYFYFIFTSVHYTTGNYTGKVAVVAMLLPIRVSTSSSDLCLLYLRIFTHCLLYILLISWQYGDCQQTYP